ncbi:MAG: hypothetical protein LBV51_04305 [Acholeplasmatales bacterium]|jgi:predicted solute-binding protein|nr:hypothetical protein [Acholeplasmatales bacterium]
MKKLFFIFFTFLIVLPLASCTKSGNYKVILPAGSPDIAFSFVDKQKYKQTVVNGPEMLSGAFASKENDLIVAPTNLGVLLHNDNYQLLGTVVLGSLYVVSINNNISSILDLEGAQVKAFGRNTTNDIILQYLTKALSVTYSVSYEPSAVEVAEQISNNHNTIGVISEPQLSTLKHNNPSLKFNVIDLQEEYTNVTGKPNYPQACIFVKKSLSDQNKKEIDKDFNDAINKINKNVDDSSKKAIANGNKLDIEILKSSIPNMNIKYIKASEARVMIDFYLGILSAMNIKLIGKIPSSSFYFLG